ncbi:MAG TPA: TonB-dependent receptor plug domain-containing protein, partial [Chitinophagaceae bacterium]|nr:TonB-dependent receptor plug domain-containing protein [Chitinophagaceae bacterium]
MKRIILFAILANLMLHTYAQELKGKVFDATNKMALSGATVSYGKKITTTDQEGHFLIACNKPGELRITFVGYQSYVRQIRSCDEQLSIGLVPAGHELDDVEITATSNQNKQLLYIPSSITKLTTTELKRGTGLFLDDAINSNIPGVTMNRRSVAAGQQFNIRGYGNGVGFRGANNNFDGLGYKVYLNGIPITDAEGITLMDDIDFGSVGNVEVSKGPSGTLYGLAIAGVVNLETIKPERGKVSIGQDV